MGVSTAIVYRQVTTHLPLSYSIKINVQSAYRYLPGTSIDGAAGGGMLGYKCFLFCKFVLISFIYFLCKFKYLFLSAFHSGLGSTCRPHKAPLGASFLFNIFLALLLSLAVLFLIFFFLAVSKSDFPSSS